MTIAEAGPVGRIKHNFSVMVRGVGFSTLIISSASQSRPLSRPPAPLAARAFLSIFRFRYRYALAPGNTFPCIFLGHSLPSRFSSAALPLSAFYPIRQLSSPSPILSLPFSPSLFLRFFYLLSRALITNFSLFSRNSRSSEQLFRADSSGFSSVCSSPIYFSSFLVSQCCFFFFFFFFLFFFPKLASLHRRYIQQSVFGTCSFRLRNVNIHSRAPSGGSGNLVMLRFPSSPVALLLVYSSLQFPTRL